MFKAITEGKARIKVPVGEKISRSLDVFYNPVMKFNRDISVILLKALNMKSMDIADPLAASGVRSIRFASELPRKMINRIVLNDGSARAVSNIKANLRLNKLKLEVHNKEANSFLLSQNAFDYIDIDPFGSPNPFLDAAMKRLKRHGILAITATDTGALAGAFRDAGIRKYQAVPLKNDFMHETGLRILIRKAQLVACQYDMALVPIMGFFKDHYYRIFFQMNEGAIGASKVINQHEFLLSCRKCLKCQVSHFNTANCHGKMEYAGPLWAGKLGEPALIRKMIGLTDEKRLKSFLAILEQEFMHNIIGFYDTSTIAKKYRLKLIPKKSAIVKWLRKKN